MKTKDGLSRTVSDYASRLILLVAILAVTQKIHAQVSPCNCSANVGAGNVNFSTLTWTGTGCPTAGSTSYTGNLCVNLANGSNLVMDKNFAISGGFGISNNGSSTFTLSPNFSLTVGGNLGDDANNNVTFVINGNLTVGGTIYGKNSNGFGGSGTVTATGLNFNHAPTCTPCNITWNVDTCVPSSPFCTIVLPITLLSFDVQEHDNLVRLTWITVSEINFDKFIIERTLNGKEFSEIGTVKGSGTSFTRKNYEFEDLSPIVGQSYYRLKALDFDGAFEYFNLAVSNYVGPKSIAFYPNPSKGETIKLMINFHPNELSRIEIFNNLGIKLDQIAISEMISEINLPKEMKAGSYMIRFTSGSYSKVVRISVL